jgi:D-alanine-D-alanine ligase
MRICLLTNQDLDDPNIREDDWPCDPRPFLPDDDWRLAILGEKHESVAQVEALIEEGFDLFFNLCDGAEDQLDLPGIEVIQTLEKHRVPFAGATSECYEPTRVEMKQAAKKCGMAVPNYVYAKNEEDILQAAHTLKFPLFVKHYNSYASVDISRNSKVMSINGLKIQANKIISKHGAALIEEYIDGVECTVLVAENPEDLAKPIVYTPVQYEFPKGEYFKHSDLKFVDYDGLKTAPVQDTLLRKRLEKECADFFVEMKAASFGRCDIRIDRTGTPYLLEINMNCGVFFEPDAYGSADFCIALDPEGHEGFTRRLIKAAFARNKTIQ